MQNKKDFAAYGSVIVFFSILSIWVSHPHEASLAPSEIVFRVEPKKIRWFEVESKEKLVHFQRINLNEIDPTFWITQTSKVTTDSFFKNEFSSFLGHRHAVQDLIGLFYKFESFQELGKMTELNLSSFGLDTPIAKFRIIGDEILPYELWLGKKKTESTQYVADPRGLFFIVSSVAFDAMLSPNYNFFEREYKTEYFSAISKAEIGVGMNKRKFQNFKRKDGRLLCGNDQKKSIEHHAKASEKKKLALFYSCGNWFTALSQIQLARYATEEESKLLMEIPVLWKVKLVDVNKRQELLEVKTLLDPSISDSESNSPTFWMKSLYLGTYARINSNQMEELTREMPL